MNPEIKLTSALTIQPLLSPGEPLWKRVPKRNTEGKMLGDFMMLIPQLKLKPTHLIIDVINEIETVLKFYEKHVVFADLNLNINVLWVSVQPVEGICLEVATAINQRVPDAKLVAQKVAI